MTLCFPTGNVDQTDSVTVTITVPTKNDHVANDFVLDAVTGLLLLLTLPQTWLATGYAVTSAQAAAYGQAVYDSIVIT